ncbi:L,D-transpeptidase family protein [Lachnospiraceae bacterium 45-W7]
MNTTEKKEHTHLVIWGLIVIILVLFLIYLGFAAFYSSHFLPGTTINGVDASGKNVEAIEEQIAQEMNEYEIKIIAREGKTEVLKGEDIVLKPIFDGSIQKELKEQDCFIWPAAFFDEFQIQIETMVFFDKAALKRKVNTLDILDRNKMKKPENAVVSEYHKEEGYIIIPEKEGTTIKKEKFMDVLRRAILKLEDSVSLEEADCYTKPKRTSESKKLKKLVKLMNKYAGTSVTYQFGEKEVVLDGETISQWISVNKEDKAELSVEKIADYVRKMAEEWDTAGKPKKLNSSYQVEVTVSGGDYGWRIDQEKETEALAQIIKDGQKVTREPEYSKWAYSRGENDYGDTYVEVNLGLQHLFYYKKGQLVLETDFVSGNEAKRWNTPEGAFGLYYKERNRTLRGEGYATPVSYWMPFNGGVGFHDAKWRRSFGGSHYKQNGSHGCVNLPYSAAKTLYDNIEAGCAILVYDLQEAEIAEARKKTKLPTEITAAGQK